ncbi:MAG: hypothetical protein NZO58_14460, partial [Gemmataceae bacterium]|nr:hypothetical protein [Gemmataceae bacterium]
MSTSPPGHVMCRCWLIALCFVAGCSTHPWSNWLDTVRPGRLYPDPKITPYGGVCRNQGPVVGPGAGGPPQINVGPPQPFGPPPPVVPPP